MAEYTGTAVPVIDDDSPLGVVSDDDFPFLASISDQEGNQVAHFRFGQKPTARQRSRKLLQT